MDSAAARNGFFDFDELDKAYAALSPDAAETDGGESCGGSNMKETKTEKKAKLFWGVHICITNRNLILMHCIYFFLLYIMHIICIDFFYDIHIEII